MKTNKSNTVEFTNTKVGFLLPKDKIVDRDNFILDLCKNKKVLHIGCTDYPFLETKIISKNLLHIKILNVAKELYGIDIDIKGIKLLREKYNIDNVICEDITNKEIKLPMIYDIIIAGEIFEHLDNIGLALNNVYKFLADNGLLIVTVPNALAFRIFFHTLRKRENIHPDHVSYFSPYTLYNLLKRHKFISTKILSYSYASNRPIINKIKTFIFNILSMHFAFFSDGIIILAKKDLSITND